MSGPKASHLLLLAILLLLPAWRNDPSLHWQTTTSEHFVYHYPKRFRTQTQKWLPTFERYHQALVSDLLWTPRSKTHLVLTDNSDRANGYSTPFPFNKIQLYLIHPEPDGSLHNYDHWPSRLFAHEYSHTLNLDQARPPHSWLRAILGRMTFPNAFVPLWAIEGSAVYKESHLEDNRSSFAKSEARFGRNHSPFVSMILRQGVASGNQPTMAEAAHFFRPWPAGYTPYLYGGRFVEFLSQTFRPLYPRQNGFSYFFYSNSNNIFPYLIDKNMRDTYGYSTDKLWQLWQQELQDKQHKIIQKIRRFPISPIRRISHGGYEARSPRYSSDGRILYYFKRDSRSRSGIYAQNLKKNNSSPRQIRYLRQARSLIPAAQSDKIYYTAREYHRSSSLYSRIFATGPKQAPHIISPERRVLYMDSHTKHPKLAYIQRKRGRYLLKLDKRKGDAPSPQVLLQSKAPLFYCRLSPSGRRLLFIRHGQGKSELFIYHIKEKQLYKVTFPSRFVTSAAWHPHGEKIVVSAHLAHSFNLFEIDLKQNIARRLTNLIGGAFEPDVHPKGEEIAFRYLYPSGFDIATLSYPQKGVGKNHSVSQQKQNLSQFASHDDADASEDTIPSANSNLEARAEDYSALPSMLPEFWLPFAWSEKSMSGGNSHTWGLYTMGTDALNRHWWQAQAAMTFPEYTFDGSLSYTLDYFFPLWTLGATVSGLTVDADARKEQIPVNTIHRWRQEQSLYSQATLPWIKMHHSTLVQIYLGYHLSVSQWHSKHGETTNTEATSRDEQILSSFGLSFDNRRYFPYSVAPEDGFFYLMRASHRYSMELGQSSWQLDGQAKGHWTPLWPNHVWALTLRAGLITNSLNLNNSYELEHLLLGDNPTALSGIKGFGQYNWSINGIGLAALSYRLPMWQPDLAYKNFPLALRDIWLAGHVQIALLRHSQKLSATSLSKISAVAVELHSRLTLGYALDMLWAIGLAKGLGPYGETTAYFALHSDLGLDRISWRRRLSRPVVSSWDAFRVR